MSDNYDRIIFPDKSYDFIAPESKFIESLISHFPQESDAIIQTFLSQTQHFTPSTSFQAVFLHASFTEELHLKSFPKIKIGLNNGSVILPY